MANRLNMHKSLAIGQLHQQGRSQREIAQTLGVSRGAVIRHLAAESSNSSKAPTGKVPTGSTGPNSTKAPTGSDAPEPATEPSPNTSSSPPKTRSMISGKLWSGACQWLK